MPLFVMDIDGTCADIRERLAKAGAEPKRNNPLEFQAWLDRIQNAETLAADKPVPGMLEIALSLAAYNPVVYVTGRAEKYREVTHAWLEKHHFPYGALIMRSNDDYRAAAPYKEAAIKHLCNLHNANQVVCIDDDGGGDCAEMYARNGWTMLKVTL